MHHDYIRLDDGHCDATGHRKMSVLGAVGTMVTTHKNFVMMSLFKGPKLFCFLQNKFEMKRIDRFHIMVLSIS